MLKPKEQRVGVFVDTQNIYHSAKNLLKAKVNFGKVLEIAVRGRKLIRAIAYVIKSQALEEQAFFEALSKQGFEVRIKELQVFVGGVKKADWDVGLAIDAIKMAPKLDVVVLVSGDGDFCPLVEYLQFLGILVEIIAFEKTCSSKLIEKADRFIDLGKLKTILIK